MLPDTGLPVEEVAGRVCAALAGGGTCVLQAAPGAGKTTVIPLRLLPVIDGRIVVLEPRRVAARAAAARMAALLGEEVGATVGVVTRDHRRTGPATRIEVVTEGILTRRVQHDPTLPGVGAVVFDEFHERHLTSDLGLALTLDARAGLRPDLAVLVMSATIDTAALSTLLGGATVVESAGRSHPVHIEWSEPRGQLPQAVATTVRSALDAGDVLAFLPGRREVAATVAALGEMRDVDVIALHGGVPAAEQDRALRPGTRRRVVVSTDLTESSVTVSGVRAVVDAGLVRRPVVDVATGLGRLRTGTASRASADQRAGRAGREASGLAVRLWSQGTHAARPAWPQPEIATADLTDLALQLAVWGSGSLPWLDEPPAGALAAARALLEELGALSPTGRPTDLGRRLADLPLHPRLGAVLLAGDPALAARVAAVVDADERGPTDLAERLRRSGADLDRAARDLARRAGLRMGAAPPPGGDTGRDRGAGRGGASVEAAGRLLAAGYPDRIAQARGDGRFVLRGGSGAALPPTDPLAGAPWLVAADVEGGLGEPGRADGRIRLAAALDRTDVEEVLGPLVEEREELVVDGELRLVVERRAGALVLDRRVRRAEPSAAATAALVAHAVARGLVDIAWSPSARALQRRAAWAAAALGWPPVDDAALAERADEWLVPALTGATSLAELRRVDPTAAIAALLGAHRRELDRAAPAAVVLAGRRVPIDWSGDAPTVSVRAQQLFGVTTHPTVAGVPVVVEVLSPAGRPLQRTADLPGFWAGTWKEVRKEMAGRYPKHPWPADPAGASPPPPRRPS